MSRIEPKIIAIDFDGTCVTHAFPKIGRSIGAEPILKALVENGHRLILFTMRSGQTLQEAVDWFCENEIPLYGVQANPTQHEWTSSPKAYAHLYIDDAALFIPLFYDRETSRDYVDWKAVQEMLEEKDFL